MHAEWADLFLPDSAPFSSPHSSPSTPPESVGKGKAVSKPAPIDILPVSSSEGYDYNTFYNHSPSMPELAHSPSSIASTSFGPFTPSSGFPSEARDVKGKGKEKEAPQLPPLSFTPNDFIVDGLDPFMGAFESDMPGSSFSIFTPPNSPEVDVMTTPVSPRRQSLPNVLGTHGGQEHEQHSYRFSSGGGKIPRLQYELPSYHPKLKGRSYSAPLPVSVHAETQLIPLVPRNYFDRDLPKEIHLAILKAIVDMAETAYIQQAESQYWSVERASALRNRWVGRRKGMRELVKLGRVSKSWRSLVFDGQLWKNFDIECFPAMSQSTIVHIAKTAGTFVRTLNLRNLPLDGSNLIDMTDSFRLRLASTSHTQLTYINLERSQISTHSLHHLLIHSPLLQQLYIKGSKAMKNATCEVLAEHCQRLVSLDASRCPELDTDGIQSLCNPALYHGRTLPLKELRIMGMRRVNKVMFTKLGKVAPDLEVLDVSYAPQMHNAYMDAFCAVTDDDLDYGVPYVILSAHEAGRQEVGRYYRRVTKLRHLNLSCCPLLTDTVCSNLAYAVPQLEFLELAGIESLEDDGLVHLLQTTPYIRRLDLEDASSISDDVIHALTPLAPPSPHSPVEPGHYLEHIVISHADDITNETLLVFIRACPRLVTLEADNTLISSTVIREFVNLSRLRKAQNANIVAVDCRGVSERLVKELAPNTRPRKGWRAYEARRLNYVDGRDGVPREFKGAQDECNPDLVVLKSFYSWQSVDAISAARAKKSAGSRKSGSDSSSSEDELSEVERRRRGGRWWSAGRRLSRSGASSPTSLDNRDGCTIM